VDLSKATVHRLLAALAHRGFVIQDPSSGHYMLGPGLLAAADSAIQSFSGLGVVARPYVERLREASDETVALHIRVGSLRICIAELPSRQPMRFTCGVGETSPIHAGSAGKLLLAYADEETKSLVIDQSPLEHVAERTITDRDELRAELARIQSRGWAHSRGERNPGAAGLSAPVFYGSEHIAAAVSVFGPEQRLTPRIKELRPDLLRTAEAITGALIAASGNSTPIPDVTSAEQEESPPS
jgi:DNA-binding IclR family transcriptional regulator